MLRMKAQQKEERRKKNSLVKIAAVAPVVASEHKHGVPVYDGGVTVPWTWGRPRKRNDRRPVF